MGSGFWRGFQTFPLLKIKAPLGPRSDLCVVVIIAWKPKSSGFLSKPAAIKPPI